MQARSVLVAFLVVCTAIVTLFSSPKNAAAQPVQYWGRWFTEIKFEESNVVGTMTIEIGYETHSGRLHPHIIEPYPIDCQEIGTVNIFEDVAEFDGSGYLYCTMPDFQQMVAKLTGGDFEIGDACDCKLADTKVDFSFSASSGNALFYMPELQFSAPYQAGPYFPQAYYELYVNGELAESEHFLPSKSITEGRGAFVATSGGYEPEFSYGLLELASTPASIQGNLKIPTNQTEFLIGFNPNTGADLIGQLRYLYVDPGCGAHGGI